MKKIKIGDLDDEKLIFYADINNSVKEWNAWTSCLRLKENQWYESLL